MSVVPLTNPERDASLGRVPVAMDYWSVLDVVGSGDDICDVRCLFVRLLDCLRADLARLTRPLFTRYLATTGTARGTKRCDER